MYVSLCFRRLLFAEIGLSDGSISDGVLSPASFCRGRSLSEARRRPFFAENTSKSKQLADGLISLIFVLLKLFPSVKKIPSFLHTAVEIW
jgi:hypothetical protein